MSNEPLITVIIPAYNCESTIETAVRSILEQTYKNTEIIVVDDHSTDSTAAVVLKLARRHASIRLIECKDDDPHRYDAKLKRNINAGYAARNTGLEHAHGEFITFQDADDASLLNRLEIQYRLLREHSATHVCIDWTQFDDELVGKKLDSARFEAEKNPTVIGPQELHSLAKSSKGAIAKIWPALNRRTPFHVKRMRIINKLFFGSLANYPGPGNSPLFKREVIEKVRFRKLTDRVWPSFMGRGADRDFNFQVAETFKNSYVFFIPLYLWRVSHQNERYPDGASSYIID